MKREPPSTSSSKNPLLLPDDDDSPDGDDDRYASARGWEEPDPYKKQREKARLDSPEIFCRDSLLEVRPAGDWLSAEKARPAAAKLFGDLWRVGELAILFADTGIGKSILAMQIGEAVARGATALVMNGEWSVMNERKTALVVNGERSVVSERKTALVVNGEWSVVNERKKPGGATESGKTKSESSVHSPLTTFHSPLATARTVLYLDFEMSEEQFNERYSRVAEDGTTLVDQYEFAEGNLRAEIDWSGDLPPFFKTFGGYMSHSITAAVEQYGATVLIVDNISYLAGDNTGASAALQLMKALKAMKKELGLSILVLAHTPKRAVARPLTVNDLAGSKMLANFADNLFAIGRSPHQPDIRYIKHIKPRNTAVTYDASNVIVCRLEKPHNFPRFAFVELAPESRHTTNHYDNSNADRQHLIEQAHILAAQGRSQRQIAKELGIALTTVNRYLAIEECA